MSIEVVVDASIILAVLLNEPEKPRIVSITKGKILLVPGCLQWEVGNAFSAMLKRKRLNIEQVDDALQIYERIALNEVDVDLRLALKICARNGIYAYDAYYLEVAKRRFRSLMTLDVKMKEVALQEQIQLEDF